MKCLLPNHRAETVVVRDVIPRHSGRRQSVGVVSKQRGVFVNEGLDDAVRIIDWESRQRRSSNSLAFAVWPSQKPARRRDQPWRSENSIPVHLDTGKARVEQICRLLLICVRRRWLGRGSLVVIWQHRLRGLLKSQSGGRQPSNGTKKRPNQKGYLHEFFCVPNNSSRCHAGRRCSSLTDPFSALHITDHVRAEKGSVNELHLRSEEHTA